MKTVTRAAMRLAFAAMAVRCYWLAAKLGNAGDGSTPLHAAARNGHTDAVTALLAHDADPSAQDKDRDTRCTSQQNGTRAPRSSPPCSMPARLPTHRTHTADCLSTTRRETQPSAEARLTGV